MQSSAVRAAVRAPSTAATTPGRTAPSRRPLPPRSPTVAAPPPPPARADAAAAARDATSATPSRRALLLSAALLGAALAPRAARASGATTAPEDNASSELVQRLLARTNAPGAVERRKKERLDAYNDRIYGDGYFEVEVGQGSARSRGISDETAGRIAAWQRDRETRRKQK